MPGSDLSISRLQQLLDLDITRCASAEAQLQKTLDKWIGEASAFKLKASLQKYLDYVNEHITQLNVVVEQEKIDQMPTTNRIMQAFILEAEEKLMHCIDPEVKDACLLAAVQQINHYKISAFGTAAAFAKALGMEEQAAIFHRAEVNEKQVDDRLSQLAEYEINLKARAPIVITQ